MLRNLIKSFASKARFSSKFEFPTKETVCQTKNNVTNDQVVCPWNKINKDEEQCEKEVDLKFHSKYKTITLYLCLPIILLMSVKVLIFDHEENRPEFVPYEYLRIRNKKFPWGDGNKTLFHNPHKNALPGGYEDEDNEVTNVELAAEPEVEEIIKVE